jgi:hypothetical protein
MSRLPHWREPITEEERKPHACRNCEASGAIKIHFPDDGIIAVGFGMACLTKNGECIYEEPLEPTTEAEYMTGAQAIALARQDPSADWVITLEGPLSGRTYQFQGDAGFVLVDQNNGFA